MAEEKDKKKFVSVRKALRELKINEEDLKKIVDEGELKTYEDEDQVKFDHNELEVYKTSQAYKKRDKTPIEDEDFYKGIEDEDFYKSTDVSFDSLFVSKNSRKKKEEEKSEKKSDSPKEDPIRKKMKNELPTRRVTAMLSEKDLKEPPKKAEEDLAFAKTQLSKTRGQKGNSVMYQISSSNFIKFTLVTIVGMLIGLSYYVINSPASGKTLSVKTKKVFAEEFQPMVTITGTIAAKQQTAATATASGKIVEVFFKEGDKVLAGDNLFRIYSKNVEDTILDAKFRLKQALLKLDESRLAVELTKQQIDTLASNVKKQIEIIDDKWKEKNSTNQEQENVLQEYVEKMAKDFSKEASLKWLQIALQETRSKLAFEEVVASRKFLEQAEKNKADLVIRSPITGKMADIETSANSYVQEGQKLAIVIDDSSFCVEGKIAAEHYAAIMQKKPVVVQVDSATELTGNIESLSKSGYLGHKVRVSLEKEQSVTLGSQVTLKFTCKAQPNSLIVPRSAVILKQEIQGMITTVFLVTKSDSKKIVRQVPVQLGLFDDEFVQVLGGLEENQKVVVGPSAIMKDLYHGAIIEE